jgi:hypothetical protein
VTWAATTALPSGFTPYGPPATYIGPEHRLDGAWLAKCPSDYMWATSREYGFMVDVLRCGLFYLDESRVCLCGTFLQVCMWCFVAWAMHAAWHPSGSFLCFPCNIRPM